MAKPGRPPGKHPGGRPVKLTPEVHQKFVTLIQNGNYIECAAKVCAISKETVYAWLKKGALEKKGIYREFSDAVCTAQGMSEARDVITVGKASEKDWKAAAWRLERKFPQRWGRQDSEGKTVTVETSPDGKKTKVTIGDLYKELQESE